MVKAETEPDVTLPQVGVTTCIQKDSANEARNFDSAFFWPVRIYMYVKSSALDSKSYKSHPKETMG